MKHLQLENDCDINFQQKETEKSFAVQKYLIWMMTSNREIRTIFKSVESVKESATNAKRKGLLFL